MKGVTFDRCNPSSPWVAEMMVEGNKQRKAFKTEDEAIAQRKEWESLRANHKSSKIEPETVTIKIDRLKTRAKALRMLERSEREY